MKNPDERIEQNQLARIEQLEKDAACYRWLRDQLAVAQAERDELLALVIRYRKETPLGHQPHMIAHLADAAIAKVRKP